VPEIRAIVNGTGSTTLTGALTKSGSGTVSFNQMFIDNGAMNLTGGILTLAVGDNIANDITLASGATLNLQGGTSLASGVDFTGAGSVAITGALAINGALGIGAGTTLTLPSSTVVTGAGTITNAGTLNETGTTLAGALINSGTANLVGGTLNGGLTNTVTGTLTETGTALSGGLANAGIANLNGGTINNGLTNSGAVNITGNVIDNSALSQLQSGTLTLASGATLTKNTGTMTWADGAINGSGSVAFTNGGLFAFAGIGARIINSPNLSFNFTDLNLPSGSLTLQQGNLTFNTTTNGATTIPTGTSLNLLGGTLTNNGPLNVSGLFSLQGGVLAGNGDINMTGGTIDMPSNSTVNWTATGPMNNSGTLNLSNRTITNPITNSGTINTTGGLAFTQLFTNNGLFNAQSGTATFSGGYTQVSGSTNLGTNTANPGNMVVGGSGYTLSGGTLGGSGTIQGDLNIGTGTFSPGYSPGAVTITGNLNMLASSILNIELGGLTQSTGYDYINVLGTANLAGTLNVLSWGGFTPTVGNSFTFMNFASSTGSFASINLPAAWGITFNPLVSSMQLLMSAITVVPTFTTSLSATLTASLDQALADVTATMQQTTNTAGFSGGSTLHADIGISSDEMISYERKQVEDMTCQ